MIIIVFNQGKRLAARLQRDLSTYDVRNFIFSTQDSPFLLSSAGATLLNLSKYIHLVSKKIFGMSSEISLTITLIRKLKGSVFALQSC